MGEAAERLGVSEDAVRKRLRRGTLAGGKDGKEWYVLLHVNKTRDETQDETRDAIQDAGQDAQTPYSRAMGRDARHEDETQDARRETCLFSRQDGFDELRENARRTASLEAELAGAREVLTKPRSK